MNLLSRLLASGIVRPGSYAHTRGVRTAKHQAERREHMARKFTPQLRDKLTTLRLEREAKLGEMDPPRSFAAARKQRRQKLARCT